MSNLIVMHDVGNTYGSMRVYTQGGKFFWDIEDYDTPALDDVGNETLEGSEISESLYKELLAHYYKDKPERDREEAMQEVLQAKRARTFNEASVYHVVCDVTGMITLDGEPK